MMTAADPHEARQFLLRELELARMIQQSLLPKEFPVLPGVGLAGFCETARQVGGDFYHVLPLNMDSLLIIIADVMGKGVPAALFASTLQPLVRTIAESTVRPSDLLTRINRILFSELASVDMFITAQVATIDLRRRQLVLANAGHCPLLLASGPSELQAIAPEGIPLGVAPDSAFPEVTLPLEPSFCAVFYTDGVTETRDQDGAAFGQFRLESVVQQALRQQRAAREIKQTLLTELRTFEAGMLPRDDQTLLVIAEEPMIALAQAA
jgi:serine phosphatase RsbU (regulator of sigma subunit)